MTTALPDSLISMSLPSKQVGQYKRYMQASYRCCCGIHAGLRSLVKVLWTRTQVLATDAVARLAKAVEL
jgi:hypothetical protein